MDSSIKIFSSYLKQNDANTEIEEPNEFVKKSMDYSTRIFSGYLKHTTVIAIEELSKFVARTYTEASRRLQPNDVKTSSCCQPELSISKSGQRSS